MGRTSKFKTADERHEARKRSHREYYARNIVKERNSALRRYHARKHEANAKKNPHKPQLYQPLPSTTALLGNSAVVSHCTELAALLQALTDDLSLWKSHETDADTWASYTRRLIRISIDTQHSPALMDFEKRLLSARRVVEVAADARIEASRRLNCDDLEMKFEAILDQAGTISHGLSELQTLFTCGGDTLRQAYERHELAWQVYSAEDDI